MLELRINGFGGQGSVTLAHLLAQAALENGEQGQPCLSSGWSAVERRCGQQCAYLLPLSTRTVNA